jgi:hypothetical protein
MAETFEIGGSGTTTQEKLEVPGDLLELPRAHKLKTADLGIDEASYQSIANGYAAGDTANAEVCETAREVFLEMMSRTHSDEPRLIRDPSGKPKLGPNGGKLAKTCSRWAMDFEDCAVINDTKSAPAPWPGHWRNWVVQHWKELMPRLVFASDNAAPGASATVDLSFNIETWKRTRDMSLSDKNVDRVALKNWLVTFLKNPVCKWDGTK